MKHRHYLFLQVICYLFIGPCSFGLIGTNASVECILWQKDRYCVFEVWDPGYLLGPFSSLLFFSLSLILICFHSIFER